MMLKPESCALRRAACAGTLAWLLAAVLTGCATEADDGTPGRDGGGASDVAQVGSCLRDAGFEVDDDALVAGVLAPPDGADPAEYETVLRECAEGTALALEDAPSGEELATIQAQLLEYVTCLRELGYTDIPDPVNGEIDLPKQYTSTDPSNTFPADAEKCQYAFDTSDAHDGES
ncbi:hypothetical protein UQW22_04380 [Isoptericola halotolerans]|uniref:hypothetical protein n=1 Tax=Isoptericola halotolerans TaxID=300560 RepID=UPI00388E474F